MLNYLSFLSHGGKDSLHCCYSVRVKCLSGYSEKVCVPAQFGLYHTSVVNMHVHCHSKDCVAFLVNNSDSISLGTHFLLTV